jgi:hypothetical protein
MRYEVRRPAAVFAIAVLAAILAFCPTLMCAPPEVSAAAHSCCPSPQHKRAPAPCDTSAQTCPYLLLQSTKCVPPALSVPAIQITAIAPRVDGYAQITVVPSQVRAVEDLYLRNRVLLL